MLAPIRTAFAIVGRWVKMGEKGSKQRERAQLRKANERGNLTRETSRKGLVSLCTLSVSYWPVLLSDPEDKCSSSLLNV
jgi:hypothetical protein